MWGLDVDVGVSVDVVVFMDMCVNMIRVVEVGVTVGEGFGGVCGSVWVVVWE